MKTTLSGRAGFAVVAVVLLLVAITGLAHAALLMAVRERQASVLEARLVGRRLVARAAATLPPLADTLPTLAGPAQRLTGGVRDALRWRTEALALDGEIVLLTGAAEMDGLAGTARTGVLAWRLDPSVRVAAAVAVVELGGEADLAGAASNSGWLDPEPSGGAAAAALCAAELRLLDSLGARVPPVVASLPLGEVLPGLGLLPGDSLRARARAQLGGELTPTPVVDWRTCVPAPTNWGSPSDPAGPCGARFVHVGAPEDLALRGGEGQGVLVVAGSLHLYEDVRFDGLVLVGGDLVVDGARLVGMARVAGRVRVRAPGSIAGSACAVARALRSLPSLRAPMRLSEGRVHPL